MKPRSFIAAALAALTTLLPGCDQAALQDIRPGITRAAEVQQRMGDPQYEFRNEDGGFTWEYSRQPAGVHCYMIRFGADKIVQSVDQVLTEANYARIQPGMDGDEVRRILGRPARVERFDNLREEVWEWRIEGIPHNEETYLNVFFDTGNGLVKKAGKRVAMRG